MATDDLPSPELLRKLLSYDPEIGALTWLPRTPDMFPDKGRPRDKMCAAWNKQFAGKQAFTSKKMKGHLFGSIFDRDYQTHRVIWAIVHGEWPENQIDHINGDPADNRIGNLRKVTNAENNRNRARTGRNTSGVVGVYWCKVKSKWFARIWVNQRGIRLGFFATFEEACAARKAAEEKYGFHPNHGRAA